MPIYNYRCDCGYFSDTFVWKFEQIVLCPCCHKPMQRLFTGSLAELKSNRSKPVPYVFDPAKCDASIELFHSAKMDFKKGRTNESEYKFWREKAEREHPNLIFK